MENQSGSLFDTNGTLLLVILNRLIKQEIFGMTKRLKSIFKVLLPVLLIGSIPISSYAIEADLELYMQDQAQERTITGTVTDESGDILTGATVRVKGTSRGTQTDLDGNYSIRVNEGDTLVFSYIGYKSLEIAVTDQEVIDVVLEIDAAELGEMVVIGYGSQKKINLTGSVQTVTFDEAGNVPASNSGQLLYGRFSGVQLTQTSGNPGADASSIVIRGVGTFGARTPLVVIDNIQYDNLTVFNNLAPSDIESITVLKDASSLAIYGSRGANGAILVTTKRGSDGEFQVSYNGYYGVQSVTVKPDFLNALDYATLINEKFRNEGGPDFDPRYTPEQIEAIRTGSSPDQFADTDWADAVLTESPIINHNLSFTGGNDKTTYRISAGFLQQESIIKSKFKSERYNLSFNINSQVKEWLNISSVTNAFWRQNKGPTGGQNAFSGDNGIIFSFQRTAPTIPLFYSNGEYGVADGAWLENNNPSFLTQNPLRRGELGNFISDDLNISSRTALRFDFTENISFETSGSANIISRNVSDFTPTQLQNDWEGRLVIRAENNTLRNNAFFDYNLLGESILRYENQFSESNNFAALLGHSASYRRIDPFSATVRGFASDEFEEINAGGTETSASGGASEDAQQSFFTRLNYDYQEKYLTEFNYRIDGSSRFGSDNQYGFFPSASVGWRISEEDFFQYEVINELKMRISWGVTGNDRINRYGYQTLLSYNQDYYLGTSHVLGASITRLGNPSIRWEETEQLDVGLDLSMLDNRLELVTDYFKRNSRDILYDEFPVPNTLGVTSLVAENAASMINEGIELGINFRSMFKEVSYSIGTNLTKFLTRSEVTGLGEGGEETISNINIIRKGEPFLAYYGYQAIGIFQDLSEVADAPIHFNGNSSAGDIRYADISGPDGAPDGIIDEYDRTVIGNPNPEWLINFNGSLEFRGFDISALFQGVVGVDRLLMGNGNMPMPDNRSNVLTYWKDRWTPENPSSELPRVGGRNNELVSSFYIQDASYMRLKNVEIGYSLNSELAQKLNVNSLRFYVAGQNLLTFTGLEYFDPEGAIGSQSNRQPPLYKTISLGINLKL